MWNPLLAYSNKFKIFGLTPKKKSIFQRFEYDYGETIALSNDWSQLHYHNKEHLAQENHHLEKLHDIIDGITPMTSQFWGVCHQLVNNINSSYYQEFH